MQPSDLDSPRLLIAASGTGGHVFPALAVAQELSDYKLEWLGVADRLETVLVGDRYPLHKVNVVGLQGRLGLGTINAFRRFVTATLQVRRLLQTQEFHGVFTTGGYIAAPAIIAARSLGLPAILHESNALPGKVTRWLSPWCSLVALGVENATQFLPKAKTICVGTPVRPDFLQTHTVLPDLDIPPDVPLIVVVGGSQGAVALNQLVRQAAPTWLAAGIWVVHLTGDRDPDRQSYQHEHYFNPPFYDHMAALLQRADFAISRAGAGTLTELAQTGTPALLVPYPYAAEDHQTYNAALFAAVGAAIVLQQSELTAELLSSKIMRLLKPYVTTTAATDTLEPHELQTMAKQAASLAIPDSAAQMATQIKQIIKDRA
ncbi:MAG: undecaprenyldiphospho-muramoylpentapeptide beta-N-acetylglucosaminyltransferase [Cyanobacteria bacterium P01_H01_bin.121]